MLQNLERIAVEAGGVVSKMRANCAPKTKRDGSPVTDADRVAEDLILERLSRIDAGTPIIAEELAAAGCCAEGAGTRFYLVDPLDGTKEYLAGGTDYTVNIALIENGVPVAGVVYAPDRGALFAGGGGRATRVTARAGETSQTERQVIRVRECRDRIVCVASARHGSHGTETFISRLPVAERMSIGSSLKFCLIATGAADVYPRIARTMQWDTAAADAVLRNAGGRTLTLDGATLLYGRRPGLSAENAFENPPFVACGALAADILDDALSGVLAAE